MRYSKSAIALASLAAVLWAGSIALLVAQLDGVTPSPLASYTALVALGLTVWWAIDRVAARLMSRDTRPPIIVHAEWTPDVASRTTVTNGPRRVASIPVPVLHMSGGTPDGETTVGIRKRGGTTTIDKIPTTGDPAYDRAFTDIANGVFGDVGDDDE